MCLLATQLCQEVGSKCGCHHLDPAAAYPYRQEGWVRKKMCPSWSTCLSELGPSEERINASSETLVISILKGVPCKCARHCSRPEFQHSGHLAMSGDVSGCHKWEGVQLASSRQRPDMPLNILQCSGQPAPTTRNHPVQNVNGARLRNSVLGSG